MVCDNTLQEWTQDTFWSTEGRSGGRFFVSICRTGVDSAFSIAKNIATWQPGKRAGNGKEAIAYVGCQRVLPQRGCIIKCIYIFLLFKCIMLEYWTVPKHIILFIFLTDTVIGQNSTSGPKASHCSTFGWDRFWKNNSGNLFKIVVAPFIWNHSLQVPQFLVSGGLLGQGKVWCGAHNLGYLAGY